MSVENQPVIAEIKHTVRAENAEHVHANLGQPLMDVSRVDEAKMEVCKQFMQEELPDFEARIARLKGNPDADKFFEWLRQEGNDQNPLLKVLAQSCDA